MNLNLDEFISGTQSFRYREALFLSQWKCYIYPNEEQLQQIIKIGNVLQIFRNRFGRPIRIHSWLRIKPYNDMIGGSMNSHHLTGGAVDFSVVGISCDEVRSEVVKHLDRLNIRCENMDGASWVHIDNRAVQKGQNRYFLINK